MGGEGESQSDFCVWELITSRKGAATGLSTGSWNPAAANTHTCPILLTTLLEPPYPPACSGSCRRPLVCFGEK